MANDTKCLSDERITTQIIAMVIQDLPNHLLKYIFSFLDVRERYRVESVCKKWRLILKLLPWTNPTVLSFTREPKDSLLGVASNELTDEMMLSLLFRCGSCVKKIEIVFDPIDYVSLTTRSVFGIGQYCTNLENLKMLGVPVDVDCLKTISRGCGKLKEFDVRTFRECNEYDEGVLAIVKNCALLEKLSASDLFLCDDWFTVVNPKIKAITLKETILTPKVMENLTTNCDTIQELNLSIDPETSMSGLGRILNRFKNSLKKLELCLSRCVDGKKTFDLRQGMKHLQNLEELRLFFGGASVNDSFLEFLVKTCLQLRVLSIPGNRVTDCGIEKLESLPNLKEIDVSFNYNLSDKGLERLAQCGALEEVYICSVRNVSERFCSFLVKNCPNLRILDASCNKKMTNRVVTAFRAVVQKRCPANPITLMVQRTSVASSKIKRCPGLEVKFSSRYGEYLPAEGIHNKSKIKYVNYI